MEVSFAISLLSMITALFLSMWFSYRLVHTVRTMESRGNTSRSWSLYFLTTLPFLLACVFNIPLPLFYLLTFVAGCTPVLVTPATTHWEWLAIHLRFLLFAAPHLMILGLFALFMQSDMRSVLNNRFFRVSGMTVTFMLTAAASFAAENWIRQAFPRFIRWNSEEYRLFGRFLWFCSLSVLMDSIPSLFVLPAGLAIVFLIGSNTLLLLMTFLFIYHLYSIARNAHLKQENLRLEEEKIKQQCRTAQLEKEAYMDVLTGTYTRRYALNNITSMIENEESFALIFLDLDGLKRVNDLQGHLAGDAYLQSFANRMRECLRPNDIFARYGGDEFLVLMPDIALEEAEKRMSMIRKKAETGAPEGWSIPFSYGLVQVCAGSLGAEEWITRADQAMYVDKNRTRVYVEGCAP